MNNGKLLLVVVLLLIVGLLYFFGMGDGAFSSLEWFLTSADAFVSAVSKFIKWLFP